MFEPGQPPRLSIIIATWNAGAVIERCLHSISEQTFTEWELLIADGASTDNTIDILKKYQSIITWWQSRADHGVYHAWNQALPRATGDYVCFLGADDAWAAPGVLADIFSRIGSETYDLVTIRGQLTGTASERPILCGSSWNYRRLGRRAVVCHPGLLHRRGLFAQYGCFDSRYRIAGDLDFLLRLPENIKTLHVDKVAILIGAAGISRKNVMARLREQRMVLSHCRRYGPIRAWMAWLDKLWRYPIARLLGLSY